MTICRYWIGQVVKEGLFDPDDVAKLAPPMLPAYKLLAGSTASTVENAVEAAPPNSEESLGTNTDRTALSTGVLKSRLL